MFSRNNLHAMKINKTRKVRDAAKKEALQQEETINYHLQKYTNLEIQNPAWELKFRYQ